MLLILAGCEVERVEPASPGSPSAAGAAVAAELAQVASDVEQRALALQAASDPEALAGGGPPPDLEVLRRELEQLRARRDELEGHITELERLAVSPGE